MKIISVLSAVVALCSVGYVNASGTVCFNFSDDNNCFRASAQYHNGYIGRSAYVDGDLYDFAARVSQNLDGSVLMESANRGTYDLNINCPYTVKPNKMGFNEVLSFDGFRVGSNVGNMMFNGTNDYQPAIKLLFGGVQDMNIPSIVCNSIPIMRFEAMNKNGGAGRLMDFKTNGITGLSYNVPFSIRGCQCNNVQDDFRNPCVLVSTSNNTNTCNDFKRYNCERCNLGYMAVTNEVNHFFDFNFKNKLKAVKVTPISGPLPSDITKVVYMDKPLEMNVAGKVAVDLNKNTDGTKLVGPRKQAEFCKKLFNSVSNPFPSNKSLGFFDKKYNYVIFDIEQISQ